MAGSKRRSDRRPVLDQGHGGDVNVAGLPAIVAHDGRLEWGSSDGAERAGVRDVAADSTAPDNQLAPISQAEQALIDANHHRIEELRALHYGADELELGDLLRIISRHSGVEVGLSVAGLALQVAGLVPIPIWDATVAAASAAGFGLRTLRHHHDPDLVREGSRTAEELWRVHPWFAVGVMANVLDAIAQAANTDDQQLEDQLDAFYPHWSRTDFELDLRQYLPKTAEATD